jgi:hypothetical protein
VVSLFWLVCTRCIGVGTGNSAGCHGVGVRQSVMLLNDIDHLETRFRRREPQWFACS